MPGLKVILPYNLRKIGAFSFAGCRSWKWSTFRGRLSSLTMDSFYGCCSLKAINLPDRVVGIGSMAFAGTILVPLRSKSVRYIDDGALLIARESTRFLCQKISTTYRMKTEYDLCLKSRYHTILRLRITISALRSHIHPRLKLLRIFLWKFYMKARIYRCVRFFHR